MTDSSSLAPRVDCPYQYCVYGIGIASDARLALPRNPDEAICHVECRRAPESLFTSAREHVALDSPPGSWHRHAALRDGSTYVRWDSVGEFLVTPDGRRIFGRPMDDACAESFQVYMLGQALSFALVKQRFEPLHGTAVVVDGRAIAFLGGNAFGKSTLAACFLEAGHQALTDDLLIVDESSRGMVAYPGPPRIKLFPRIADRFLRRSADADRMNGDTDKLILPLDARQSHAKPAPLEAIYVLAAPRDTCRQPSINIDALPPRDAFVELVKNTFNRRVAGRTRLECQFGIMAGIADQIPVRKLIYPRAIDRLPEVRDAVVQDALGRARADRSEPAAAPAAIH